MLRRTSRSRILPILIAALSASAVATAEAGFRFPRRGVSLASGATVDAAWTVPCDRDRENEGELVLSLDDGRTFSIRLTGEMPACVSAHVWRVPDVATTHARLALRRGRDEPGQERIVAVSQRFTIIGSPRPEGAGLTRGSVEWWTHEALAQFEAEDFLDQSLGREAAWHDRRAADDEAEDSGPGALRAPTPLRIRALPAKSTRPAFRGVAIARVLPILPLRL